MIHGQNCVNLRDVAAWPPLTREVGRYVIRCVTKDARAAQFILRWKCGSQCISAPWVASGLVRNIDETKIEKFALFICEFLMLLKGLFCQ